VVRHAHARHASVRILKIPDAVRLEICDDGKSFPSSGCSRPGWRAPRSGRMRERVEMLGGRFAVESAPGKGTTVIAEIPFVRLANQTVLKSSRSFPSRGLRRTDRAQVRLRQFVSKLSATLFRFPVEGAALSAPLRKLAATARRPPNPGSFRIASTPAQAA